jgi:2-keto-myo-inositol isomerase
MPCLHINDYPAVPDRSTISDKDRVYPGDGVAPLASILKSLVRGGFRGVLSLELFNQDYWQFPAEQVARTGIEKIKRTTEALK